MYYFLILLSATTLSLTLRDSPLVSSFPSFYLDGQWEASEDTLGLAMNATIPGDVITDLQNAGVIGDPFYELTFFF